MADLASMRGKEALITGGTAGIGRAAAVALARLGASVTVIGRDAGRCRAAAAEIASRAGAGRVEGLACDLGSLQAVRRVAADFAARHPKLDVLALNAGFFLARRHVSPEGYEQTLAASYLGHFLLTESLLPQLRASGDGRVISTGVPPSSMKFNFEDVMLEKRYSVFKAVPNAMAAKIMYTLDLAEREAGRGVTANFFHPGIVRTGLFADMAWPLRLVLRVAGRPPEKAADTLVYLASDPALKGVTGRFFHDRKEKPVTGPVTDGAARARLRELALRLTAQPG